ncbi:MAG: hypothetical protein GY789_16495 [Hyphomicrobiales bacterium]|nr:hypothetical protein [Hyphomicrobiales bacterium]
MKRPLEERLANYPELRAKFEDMLDIVENAKGDLIKANDAEERVLEEVGKIGNQALTGWAQTRERMIGQQMEKKKGIIGNEKKI